MFDYLDVEIVFSGEMDEFWSFVGNKGNQRWTWYAIERKSGCILAWSVDVFRWKKGLVTFPIIRTIERYGNILYFFPKFYSCLGGTISTDKTENRFPSPSTAIHIQQ
ncbi:hypothetical protein EZS27_033539 [termite gut metagenome]|uniref:Transposase n=1 Tax=termite gut metagenome TaxID=433724 RepID=A0A5J4Q2G4_9ZZZZ